MIALGIAFLLCQAPMRTHGKPAFGEWGFETDTVSKTVKPGDDFFTYADEGWIKSTKIPASHWDYGQTTVLGDDTDRQVHEIIDEAVKSPAPPGDPRRQLKDLYESYMDTAQIERLGLNPIRADLHSILAIKSHEDVARWMADPASSSLVATYVFLDEGNTNRRLVHLDQINLGQPILGLQTESYSRMDGSFPADRKAYADTIARIFELAGIDRASQRAQDVLALETKLAACQWNFDQMRDRKANYHPLSVEGLEAYAPGFPWRAFLSAKGLGGVRNLILGTDTAVRATAEIFRDTPVDTWASYLAFHWIQNQIGLLPAAFRSASFDFYGKRLAGQKTETPRDGQAFSFVNSRMRDVVGRIYVRRYFPPASRDSAEELFGYLRRAFQQSLAMADWMDAATRAQAEAKLATYRFKVGYPTQWRDYSRISIRKDDLVGNARRLNESDWALQVASLKANRSTLGWNDSPQTVNASYNPQMNAIELPAAFLQPPFFDANADPAVNFGSIGAIIGHEMGHGFDDQGAHFDSHGQLRDWWTADSERNFKQRTNALVGQYDAFSPLPGLHLNGKMTIGENIGDLTGVSIAYRAYHLYLDDHPDLKNRTLDGFTNDQRYFLSWGQTWRYIAPESAIRWLVQYGYHAPAQYRVNGVVRNIDAWYKAFNVTPGQKLYLPPAERVRLW